MSETIYQGMVVHFSYNVCVVFFPAQVAFCGELFDLTFLLQYLRFVPEIEEIKFFLQVCTWSS